MSIFGFGTPSELTTPIGIQIKSATDSLRMNPDWAKNMDICDLINRSRDGADQANQALRAIRRRLQDNENQTVYLALVLLETCMKNCGMVMATYFDKPTMDEVVVIATKGTKGVQNTQEALRLIQQWGRAFEKNSTVPRFFDTYMALKSRGTIFPKEDTRTGSESTFFETAEVVPRRSQSGTKPSQPMPAPIPTTNTSSNEGKGPIEPTNPPNVDEFEKLQMDLIVVMEKVRLCREILQVSPGIESDEALADVIGFLEACRDRMIELIEAGTHGVLGEELFAEVLKVNDAVLRTLDAERMGVEITIDDDVSGKAESASGGALLDLDGGNTPVAAKAPSQLTKLEDEIFGVKSSATIPSDAVVFPSSSDPFGDVFAPSSAAPVAAVAVASPAPAPSVNPFDNIPTALAAVLPPQPPIAGVPTNVAPVHGNNAPDDFDLLFDSLPSVDPGSSSTSATNQAAKQEDIDSFFASLK